MIKTAASLALAALLIGGGLLFAWVAIALPNSSGRKPASENGARKMRNPATLAALTAASWLALPIIAATGHPLMAAGLMCAVAGFTVAAGARVLVALDRRAEMRVRLEQLRREGRRGSGARWNLDRRG